MLHTLKRHLVTPGPDGIETVGPFGPPPSSSDDYVFPYVMLETRDSGSVVKPECLYYPDKEGLYNLSYKQSFVWPVNLIYMYVQLVNVFISQCRIPFYIESPTGVETPLVDVKYKSAMFYYPLTDDQGNLHICAIIVSTIDPRHGKMHIQPNIFDPTDREYLPDCKKILPKGNASGSTKLTY